MWPICLVTIVHVFPALVLLLVFADFTSRALAKYFLSVPLGLQRQESWYSLSSVSDFMHASLNLVSMSFRKRFVHLRESVFCSGSTSSSLHLMHHSRVYTLVDEYMCMLIKSCYGACLQDSVLVSVRTLLPCCLA